MKSFKFRMQAVLEQRERQETVAKSSFAEAQIIKLKAEKLLAELLDVKSALLTELSARRSENFDPMETRIYQEYLQTISKSIQDQEQYVREANRQCEVEKLQLISASQNRQALVTVKDRDQHAHQIRAQRVAQSELDDIANARYSYQQRTQE